MTVWFDDLAEGMEFTSRGRTLTESDVVSFCGVSGDFHPLHVDAVHAAESPFGERLVHGALVLSVATGQRSLLEFLGESLVAFLEIRSWRFVEPVFIGDTVRTTTVVSGLQPTSRPGRGVVVQDVSVRNQRGEVVQEGKMVNLLRSRPETRTG
ncbi:MaoC/PaaZ C-terminal domain-containing protein [Nocardioides sp. AE5]|uniref:MaoC/PaaZ C-terminal domain-containing protein n=1 Tax=Nocardioides sp. AE5 TaxID=2962573 RepID=UPI0028813418|nr:MaoC/PaaZ C-terminal domain-containing protein [Nocardioides sp. AE5]MDT0203059.1 MaoC/PaaZ C-terminal domain-containing protein [Nocardioides sp. AE5]